MNCYEVYKVHVKVQMKYIEIATIASSTKLPTL